MKLKTELVSLGVPNVNKGFPRTHMRSLLGMRLTDMETSARAAALDAWLKRMFEIRPELQISRPAAAVALILFLEDHRLEGGNDGEFTLAESLSVFSSSR